MKWNEILLLIFNGVVAGVVIWYTYETRLMRIEYQRQTQLFAKQMRLAIRAVLIPSIIPHGGGTLQKYWQDNPHISDAMKSKIATRMNEQQCQVLIGIHNPTSIMVTSVTVVYVDGTSGKWFLAESTAEVIPGGSEHVFLVPPRTVTSNNFVDGFRNYYGDEITALVPYIVKGDESRIYVIFRDSDGQIHLISRNEFTDESFQLKHGPVIAHL